MASVLLMASLSVRYYCSSRLTDSKKLQPREVYKVTRLSVPELGFDPTCLVITETMFFLVPFMNCAFGILNAILHLKLN